MTKHCKNGNQFVADISHDRLTELLNYNPDTGVFTNKTTRANALAGTRAGHVMVNGYRTVGLDGRVYLAHRLAWFYTHAAWPVSDVDHINRDPDDNRIANLRVGTHAQNLANAKRPTHNTSGIKGVSRCAERDKWLAVITRNKRRMYIGRFDTIEEAEAAYRAAAEKLDGEFVRFE